LELADSALQIEPDSLYFGIPCMTWNVERLFQRLLFLGVVMMGRLGSHLLISLGDIVSGIIEDQ
jgi:hypothetical protein